MCTPYALVPCTFLLQQKSITHTKKKVILVFWDTLTFKKVLMRSSYVYNCLDGVQSLVNVCIILT